ncbi:MAG: hypothetical protein WBO98_11565 [Candidatus Nitrotoga sp.]|jgi:hypothetical protein
MSERKHPLPPFLEERIQPLVYKRWLARKAAAHLKRDRKRGYENITGAIYRDAIHEAVLQSDGKDVYTGEELNWCLISTYNNSDSESGKHGYKAGFALLPTVDHIESSVSKPGFCICAWRTNATKHDLSHQAFIDICKKVLEHAGYRVEKDS